VGGVLGEMGDESLLHQLGFGGALYAPQWGTEKQIFTVQLVVSFEHLVTNNRSVLVCHIFP